MPLKKSKKAEDSDSDEEKIEVAKSKKKLAKKDDSDSDEPPAKAKKKSKKKDSDSDEPPAKAKKKTKKKDSSDSDSDEPPAKSKKKSSKKKNDSDSDSDAEPVKSKKKSVKKKNDSDSDSDVPASKGKKKSSKKNDADSDSDEAPVKGKKKSSKKKDNSDSDSDAPAKKKKKKRDDSSSSSDDDAKKKKRMKDDDKKAKKDQRNDKDSKSEKKDEKKDKGKASAIETPETRAPEPKPKAAPKADVKGGNKKKGGKAEEEDDLDAALAELGITLEAPAPKAAGKKKGKKVEAKKNEDDEFAAAIAENDAAVASATPEEKPKVEVASKEQPKAAPKAAPKTAAATDAAPATPADEAKSAANRAKKEKKKAKMTSLFGADEPAKEDAPPTSADAEPAAPAAKATAKKGAPAKKESAVVRMARERLEEERRVAAEKAAYEAEQARIIKEEEDREAAEEAAREEERRKKREAKQAKIAKQKAEGTYMTAADKQRDARMKALREQWGYGAERDETSDNKPRRNFVVESKKKKKKEVVQDTEGGEDNKVNADVPAKSEEAKDGEEEDADWEKLGDDDVDEAVGEKDTGKKETDDADKEEDDDEAESGSDDDSDMGFRAPIIVIMGHVDTGKTKLLDKIRKTNVQEGEAGGITQQIGATFFPDIALLEQTQKVDKDFDIEVPGVMVIDTPGHESFNNLRKRGSSLCDLAILVIDLQHGLEPQTVESLEMLKKRQCPFVIAMNKIDVCYGWQDKPYTAVREALDRQEQHVIDEFEMKFAKIKLQLNERGMNCELYWKNDDPASTVSIVPTSALTGEGVPDLLYNLLHMSQTYLGSQLEREEELACTVIEVKNIEGLGTTIDVVLVNGTLREGDKIVIAGIHEPIVTHIRGLHTPQPMKELRVKNEYVNHKMINQSMGIKISAPGLENAVAGTELFVAGPEDDLEELMEEVSAGFDSILAEFRENKAEQGVYVKASTLGSLEALLSFLSDSKIPVFDVGIGEVHGKDVKKAMIMKEKSNPEYAVVLAFDVAVNKEAKAAAAKAGVEIMTADIIYNLFDKFTAYMDKIKEAKKVETKQEVVFPVMLGIDKNCVFRKRDPLILGCDVISGQLRVGTPLCVPEKDNLEIGRVASIEVNNKPKEKARRGDKVCIKIEQTTAQNHISIGRHFEVSNKLYSKISRNSIDTLKANFRDEVDKEDWQLIQGMKSVFGIV